jgi:hypothetical protein
VKRTSTCVGVCGMTARVCPAVMEFLPGVLTLWEQTCRVCVEECE